MEKDEIKYRAPVLYALKNKGIGFKTPTEYFDELERHVSSILFLNKHNPKSGFIVPENYFQNVDTEIEIKTIHSNRKEDSFQIPPNYFESVESSVLAKLNLKKENRIFTLHKFWIPAIVAAMLILTFGIFNTQKKTTTVEMADMEKWIDNGVVDLNSYELASVYEAEFEQIGLSDFIENDNLEDYLQNDIDDFLYHE